MKENIRDKQKFRTTIQSGLESFRNGVTVVGEGVVSIFDIVGGENGIDSIPKTDEEAARADNEALRSDSEAVGADLRSAILDELREISDLDKK